MNKTELFAFVMCGFSLRPAPYQALGEEGHQWVLVKLMKCNPLSQALL